MRYGEWWASSLDLWGSWHPYPLLPTTHLADFVRLLGEYWWSFYSADVDGFFDVEGPLLDPDNLLFLSVLPRYFFPMMQAASCLAHTLYNSCIFLWVEPLPKTLLILNAHIAAISLVGLFIFSSFSDLYVGSGIISSSTLSYFSYGNSLVLLGASGLVRADVALTWINGLMLACNTTISYLGFKFLDNLLSTLHTEANSECATSRL